jgi:hypothetical protein
MTVSTPPSYNSSPPSTPRGKFAKTEYPAVHTIPSAADLGNAYEPHPGMPWSTETPPYHAGEDLFPSNVRRSMGLFSDPTTIYQAERRYAQAILASMPLDNEEPSWLNAVHSTAGAPSDQAGYYFPEENMVALQLRQYSEVPLSSIACQVVLALILTESLDVYLSFANVRKFPEATFPDFGF